MSQKDRTTYDRLVTSEGFSGGVSLWVGLKATGLAATGTATSGLSTASPGAMTGETQKGPRQDGTKTCWIDGSPAQGLGICEVADGVSGGPRRLRG